MAGKNEDGNLKGLSKHFNSTTITGRANAAKATIATIGLITLYFWLKPKK